MASSPSPMDSSLIQHWTESYSAANCAKAINSGSVTEPLSRPWLRYEPIISDFSYYSLPFENTITIFGNIIVEKVTANTLANASLVLALRFTVWSPYTSSYLYFGESGNIDESSIDVGYVAGVSGSVGATPTAGATLNVPVSATLSAGAAVGAKSVWTPFKATISIPSVAHDRLNIINLDYAFFKMYRGVGVPGTDFEFNAKVANFVVMSSRTLASQASSGIGDFELNNYDPGGGTA
jgi:hypothetical protein